jgi:hypothetical protein
LRRIQIHIEENMNRAAEREARRRGVSKAALIRDALARELSVDQQSVGDPWKEMTGWLNDGPVADLDAEIYDRKR